MVTLKPKKHFNTSFCLGSISNNAYKYAYRVEFQYIILSRFNLANMLSKCKKSRFQYIILSRFNEHLKKLSQMFQTISIHHSVQVQFEVSEAVALLKKFQYIILSRFNNIHRSHSLNLIYNFNTSFCLGSIARGSRYERARANFNTSFCLGSMKRPF